MKAITKLFAAALLAGTSQAALAADPRIGALEDQLHQLQQQIDALKASQQAQADAATAAQRQQAEIAAQIAETSKTEKKAARPGIANGRLSVASADGAFSATIRATLQGDVGYYMQSKSASSLPSAYGPDLSSGANMRRVYLGLQGKVFSDWSYYFLYDFGGAATETPGSILYAYVQYDGFGPWHIRAGAFAPSLGIEDQTASSNLMFFERNSPANVQRGVSGAEGRDALSVYYAGKEFFGAVTVSGSKVSSGSKSLSVGGATSTANYDEQAAVSGRLAWLAASSDDMHWLVSGNVQHVFAMADLVPEGSTNASTTPGGTVKNSFAFADMPEFTVDSNGTKLVNTGSLPAGHVTSWGLETAANYQNFYAQGGYFSYTVSRAPIAYNVYSAAGTYAVQKVRASAGDFSGWYLQGSWILTGEKRGYDAGAASFTAPTPAHNFSLKDGTWGAFEIVGRYSDLDLNSHAGDDASLVTGWTGSSRTYTFYNTVRGGEQKIVTLGLNWYFNPVVRLAVDYQHIDISRLSAVTTVTTTGTPALPGTDVGQSLDTLAMRLQLAI